MIALLAIHSCEEYGRFAAAGAAIRLSSIRQWRTKLYGNSRILVLLGIKPKDMDICVKTTMFTKDSIEEDTILTLDDKSVVICVDSQAAIKALESVHTTSSMMKECRVVLNALGRKCLFGFLATPTLSILEKDNLPYHCHARRTDLGSNRRCPDCGIADQDTDMEHAWCLCPSLVRTRLIHLGDFSFSKLQDIRDIPLKDKLIFMDRIDWFHEMVNQR